MTVISPSGPRYARSGHKAIYTLVAKIIDRKFTWDLGIFVYGSKHFTNKNQHKNTKLPLCTLVNRNKNKS